MDKATQDHIYRFLNDVRNSGRINMFCAAPLLAQVFDLKPREAREILLGWMDSFKQESTL